MKADLPTATTDKELDMSKTPLTPSQRYYLWLALTIVSGVLGAIYLLKH